MGEYIMSLIGAGILCSVSEILSPEKWQKYIKFFTGIVIAILIVAPIKKIDLDIFDNFSYTESKADTSIFTEKVREELEKRICEDIRNRIKESFGCESEVAVRVDMDKAGNICGVSSIDIKTGANRAMVSKMICEIYGVSKEQVNINGR